MKSRPYILPFSPGALSSSGGIACPRCNASVFRVSRRWRDLFVSFFIPIRRYRCTSMTCSWEGNRRVKQTSLPGIVRETPLAKSATVD